MQSTMSQLQIRKGKKSDLSGVLGLIRELATFEKAPDQVTNSLEAMERDGFGEKPVFEFFVAETESTIVGMALYFIKYSTWKGKGLYLDDLVVTEKYRGKGIGKKLFDRILEEAQIIHACQIHWQVLDWNEPAIRFYKKYGASIEAEWLDCKLNEKQIREYGK
jgi:GNAT superfamily N-acetyltransferase